MAKLKSLTDLGELYSSDIQPTVLERTMVKEYNEILTTDTNNYLPESSSPKVGEGFGKEKEELAKDTGPESADNFKKVDEKQDPGSSKKAMKKDSEEDSEDTGSAGEAGDDENTEDVKEKKLKKSNIHQERAAKQTLPKEKIQETMDSALKNNKYKKPTFTMSKSKFDKLYEDAINNAPFTSNAGDDAPVDTTDADTDVAPDTDTGDTGPDMAGDTVTITLDRDLAQKLHAAIMGVLDSGTEEPASDMDDMGADDTEAPMMEEGDDDPVAEAVDAEDLGHAGVGSGAKSEQLKDGHKMHKVGSLKTGGAASEQGGPKGGDGTVQKAKDFDKGLQKTTGSREVGNLKVSKGTGNAFE